MKRSIERYRRSEGS